MNRALIESESQEIALQLLQKFYLDDQKEGDTEGLTRLRVAVQRDQATSAHQWNEVIKLAQEYGYEEVTD